MGGGHLLLLPHLRRIWWTLCILKVGKKGTEEEGRGTAESAQYGSVFTAVEHPSKRSASVGASFMQPFLCGQRWLTA